MMPVIAHNLFEMMQVIIGSVRAFTERCVRGVEANRMKAEHWLMKNAAVITALNPLIGYAAGAALAKEAMGEEESIFQVAIRKAVAGELHHRDEERLVTQEEVEAALSDLKRLTEGGIIG
jgi:fumarate hydratase class II